MTKVVVAGSRDIHDEATVHRAIENSGFEPTEIVSGGADGVDDLGEAWAEENNVAVERKNADWDRHGKSAGPKRNKEMARYADKVVVVWDGESTGTRNMITTAMKNRLPIHIEPVGYEGVIPNTLEEGALLRRFPEIKRINDVWVRSVVIEGLLAGYPDYLWEVSSSTNHHPPDERGKHGQWLHVKRVFYAYEQMVESIRNMGEISERQVELGKAAVFFHDMFKYGLPPYDDNSFDNEHDTLAAEYIRNFTDFPEEVAMLCDIHNGPWGNGFHPENFHELLFHEADMMASRDAANLGIYDASAELEEISDRLIDAENP